MSLSSIIISRITPKYRKYITKTITCYFSSKNHFSSSLFIFSFINVERRKMMRANRCSPSTAKTRAALLIGTGQPE